MALPVPAVGPRDCTVATVVGEPPPKTKDVAPICAPAASWTTAGSDPPAVTAPLVVSSHDVVPSEAPAGERPPRIRSRPPTATTASRETGAVSGHGSIPASSDGVPATVEPAWLVPAAPEAAAAVLVEAEDAEAVVVVTCPAGGGEPPEDRTTTSAATSRTRKPSTTARRWRSWACRRRCWLRPARGGGLLTAPRP